MIDPHRQALLAHGYHRLRVKAVVQETADARTFALDVPDELENEFAYRPGQFCTFRVNADGKEHVRSYSMSSDPDSDADLAVTVKRVAGGVVSNWLNDAVAEGDLLEVTRPAGVFCPTTTSAPIVAFCGGSGITPVMSIAKNSLAGTPRTVRLLYANRDSDSVIFSDQLNSLALKHPDRLEVVRHYDVDSGFVNGSVVARFATLSPDADFYICGPGPFMDLVESTLIDMGVGADRILIERFNVDEPPPGPRASEPAATESVTLILKGKSTTVRYQASDTVLETARRATLAAPYSCEAGNCATCMAFVREGTVRMRVNNALTPDEVEEGWVLTCQSMPTSPAVTVEYEAL